MLKTRHCLRQIFTNICCIYAHFDDGKDKTLNISEKNGRQYRYPKKTYFFHGILLGAKLLMEYLLAVECDRTYINVGENGAIIRLLEKRFNNPL